MAVILYQWLLVSLLGSGWFAPSSNKHPFYVSVTEISHNSKEKSIEITCKIFADDMEDVLKKNYKATVDLTSVSQQKQNDKLVTDYIKKNLLLHADGRTVALQYVGFEKDGESVYCYFEGQNIASIKKIDIANSILQDFTNQQINIIHATVNGKRQSTKLDFPNKQASFSF